VTVHAADESLDRLLEHLKRERGFDFTGYKRASLERRIRLRMDLIGVGDYDAYREHLELHPDEFPQLFNTILINVTAFLRDGEAWDFVAGDVLPRLLQARPPAAPIRVWCAGCATGEETYTLAMVLADAMGEGAYLERVKIYATDVDEAALDQARQGIYPARALEGVPTEQRDRYFDRVDDRFAFRKNLRRSVIFGRNDLVQDAPISRVDLLLCRNTLMYFTAETQARVLRRLHFALNPDGFLFLGKSEMLITHTDLFEPVSLKRRVFSKVAKPTLRDRFAFALPGGDPAAPPGDGVALRAAALDAVPVAQILIDRAGTLAQANAAARALLKVAAQDVGRSFKDLELSYRPVELRAHLDTVFTEHRAVTLPLLGHVTPRGDVRDLEVAVAPLIRGDDVLGAAISFVDVTARRHVEDELDRSRRELGAAYEELQSTVEELETTNEELQSTNEELETTNEELQSTNEELETMNEELQSSNEELETMNDELRQRSLELNEVNAVMETILGSFGAGVVVVDRTQHVRIWNRHSEELWGVRADEAEQHHVLALDIGLPVDRLKAPLRTVLAGDAEREELLVDAIDRRGRQFTCRLTVVPLHVGEDEASGAIVLAERVDGSPAAAAAAAAGDGG
jgi:two-component system, chemotaxis family, CheB/CheR fusion protein